MEIKKPLNPSTSFFEFKTACFVLNTIVWKIPKEVNKDMLATETAEALNCKIEKPLYLIVWNEKDELYQVQPNIGFSN